MADKHLKNCSTSLDIRKMEIESIMIYHSIPTTMSKIKKFSYTNVDEDMKELGLFIYSWWKYKMVCYFGKSFVSFLKS